MIIRQLVVTSLISSSAGRPANSLGGTHRVGSVNRMIPLSCFADEPDALFYLTLLTFSYTYCPFHETAKHLIDTFTIISLFWTGPFKSLSFFLLKNNMFWASHQACPICMQQLCVPLVLSGTTDTRQLCACKLL